MKLQYSRRSFLQSTGLGALALTLNAGQAAFAQETVQEDANPLSSPSALCAAPAVLCWQQ
jgi:hypothetical protein